MSGVVLNIRDISQQVQKERELKRQHDRLSAFVDGVSHDLRNPLEVAKPYVREPQRDEVSDDDAYLAKAEDALTRMEDLTENLLELAKKGEAVSETTEIDLSRAAVRSWSAIAAPQATMDTTESMTIEADRDRLKQLLQNLFSNAVEHGDDDAHRYTVHVVGGLPSDCTCPADEYHSGACKHRVAVAMRPALLEAAEAGADTGLATEGRA